MNRIVAVLMLLAALPAHALTESEQEIQYLLATIEQAPCTFIRNGKSYDSADARSHIERKYNYILGKGHHPTAEQFIEHAATQSSFSGRAYQIQCPGEAAQPSAQWLLDALSQYRKNAAE
ncbi:DUF5329 domain-containing protein [Marinobacter hydrocarbonoclasticus]|nr:DUF5329 domain-containing protein [Marinobacter nauticus]